MTASILLILILFPPFLSTVHDPWVHGLNGTILGSIGYGKGLRGGGSNIYWTNLTKLFWAERQELIIYRHGSAGDYQGILNL
jgi:hypothetical protein